MRQPVRVVLADDHDAFIEGLGMVLSTEDDLEVVAVAGDGAAALQAVLDHQPDVLVADARMPGPEIGELVRLVGTAQPATRVLLLAEDALSAPTGRVDPGPAATTRAVSGYELAEAIRQVATGGWVTMAPAAPAATTPIPPARPERDDSLELLRSLSERERQVLALLGRGHANRRIAEICNLSLNTVRTHVQNVLVKLGVHSKLEAATIAVRHGLVHGWATIASLASPDVVEPPFGQLRFLRRYPQPYAIPALQLSQVLDRTSWFSVRDMVAPHADRLRRAP